MELGRNCHSENELDIEIERHSDTSLRAAVSTSSDVLAEATTSNDGIRRLLKTTAEKLGWDVGALWMMDFATRRLHLLHGWASRSPGAESFLVSSRAFSFAPGEGFPGKVFETGRAHWLRDAGNDGRYWRSDLAARHGIKSIILFPVTSKSHTFGVLEFCAHHSTSMDEEQMRSMAATGSRLGEFLERCQATDRFSEVTRRNVMVQALVQVERNNLRALFAQAPAAIAVLRGPDLRYELSNPFHRQLVGGREVVGKKLREAFPDRGALDMVSLIERAYHRGEPVVLEELPVTLAEEHDGNARKTFMSGVMQPLVGANSQVDGIVVFAYDVTELVSARARVEGAEERLRLALDASNVGSWEFYPPTNRICCDAKCRTLFGLPSGTKPTTAEFESAVHPDDRALVASAQARALDASLGGDYSCEYRTLGLTDGQERWVSARGRTFFDAEGKPERVLGTGIDITAERRALERTTFLARAGTLFASSLDYRKTLAQVVELAVPRLADCCTIELVNERGEVECLELAHADPRKSEIVRSLRESSGKSTISRSLFAHVVRTAEAAYIPNMTDELLVKLAGDERQARILQEIGPRSAILMPLLGRERTIGVIGLSYGGSGRRYTEEDLDFAEELARRAALAIENAMLYRAAQTAIQHRDDFLSVASHELKTPVTTLMLQTEGFLGDLQHGTLGTEELKSRLEGSLEQIHRLSSLLDDLLDVSRVASGHLRIARTTMDLSELALEVISRFRESARRVGCRIDMKLEGRAVGRWDRDRLEQVLTNLLSNALKFAPGKPVEVLIQNRGDHMQIGVCDQGPGIAPADRQNVFDRFERATSTSGVGGLGLGLWIAREIVRAHGGDIVVGGEHGRGADFRVALPL